MAKNIVVLSDGTGQDGGRGHDTNVYKLFRMMEDRTSRQVVFYDQGLGTDWRKVTGNAFGAGFSKNILQCYRFIYDNYEAGDKIFLLGFSRGAATVRSLANFIHYFGILPKARPELIKRAWKIYRAGRRERPDFEKDKREDSSLQQRTIQFIDRATTRVDTVLRESLNDQAKKFVHEHPNHWVSIEFLGVWDTVPALGLVPLAGLNVLINNIPWFQHRFHDFKLHESVQNAYHALAIDDDRLWFHPTVWKECNENQNVQQVWFSGSHTDVGGGFMAGGLSDVSLEWMVEKAVSHGIRLYLGSRSNWNFVIAPDATDREHPPRSGFGVVYKKGLRDIVWDKPTFDSYGPPKLHASVLERLRHDSSYQPWIMGVIDKYNRQLPDKFEESTRDEHKKLFEEVAEANAEVMLTGEGEVPERLANWLEQNPFEKWQQENYPEYTKKKAEGLTGEELHEWLEGYTPYKNWLAETYSPFERTEYGKLMIEPYSKIYKYKDNRGQLQFTNKDKDEATCKAEGITEKDLLKFRDYDKETLKLLLEAGLEKSERGAYESLLDRVDLPRPITAPLSPTYKNIIAGILSGIAGLFRKRLKEDWKKRYKYDRDRWYGK